DEMVRTIDENANAARAAIEGASDADLMAEWTLLKGGEALFTLPKIAVLRTFVMDHMIHHRGQLTVYLRLLDVPLKQTFGPTADFPDF
ncbi:MAG TPA: DinB family protein, partial [Gemmatimonadota bacterium]|nr:DinB family protein [Gemmatimonadota bacterium]